ncbi:MAG: TonB-dependent receptor, partial [Alistipes sp.]|nr:TonB-dependent receptor [Alistipes sp.]
IVTRKMHDNGVRTDLQAGYGSYNTLQTELTNRIRAGSFTSVVTGSYDRSDGHRRDMGFEQYGGSARLGYEFSKAWSLAANVQLTHFNAQNPGTVSVPLFDNLSHITRGVASASLSNRYEKSSGSLSFFYNWGRHRINDGYSAGEQPLDYRFCSRDRMAGVSWYQNFALFRGNRTTLGFDYRHFGGKAWNRYLNGDPDRVTADKTMDEVAAYVDFRQHLTAWCTVDAGVRIDRHSHAGTEWVPQAGVSFQLPLDAQIKLSASKGFRFPTIREMYMFPPQNPDLRPERLWNYELAFAQRLFGGRFSYGVNVFYIDGENLIQTVRIDGRPLNVNMGRIENTGLELQAAWRISRAWAVDANYSYLHMAYPVLAAPRNKLFVGADFSKGRWSVSTGVQFVKGLYTALNPVATENDFVLWNLTGRLQAARWLSLFVRGENLLAQRYEINAGFPMPKATVLAGVNLDF